jgi:hypothetical protein
MKKIVWALSLAALSLHTACEDRHQARKKAEKDKKNQTETTTESNTASSSVNGFNFYIENSGSMFGYFKGNTEFKTGILDLASRLKSKSVSFFYINDKPYSISSKYEEFIQNFDESKARTTGNTNNSDVAKIIQMAIDEVLPSGKAALIASDFIFNITQKNPLDDLSRQKFIIKSQIERLKAKNYGVLILQFSSHFEGKYFDYLNRPSNFTGNRPYYIWLIAPVGSLNSFMKDFQVQTIKGYQQFVVFYDTKAGANFFYSILPQTEKVGSFKRPSGSKDKVVAIEDASLDERKKELSLALALDLKGLPIDEKYYTNPEHYTLKSSGKNSFSVVSIQPISQARINNNDNSYKGSATHVMVIKTTDKISDEQQTLSIGLKKTVPSWIKSGSTENDTNIQATANKTFGLSYLVEGVSEAFDMPGEEPEWFNIKITIKK